MKKILIYALIIIIAVILISVGYYWLTCPPKVEVPQAPLPSIAEMHRKAMEAIDKGEDYSAPHDPNMVVEDKGMKIVVNRLSMMLKDGEGKETAEELATKVKGVIVGYIAFRSFNEYEIELQTSTIEELETALSVIRAESRVEAVTKSGFLKLE